MLVDKPSIVIGRKGSAGEITLVQEPFWPLDVTYYAAFDASKFSLRFLYYLLKSLDLPALARGVKPGINRNDVYRIEAPTPPLPEQQRIVAILDQAFENIAKAKANAKRNAKSADDLGATMFEDLLANRASDAPTASLSEIAEFKNGLNFTRSSKGEVIKIVGVADFWTPDDLDEVQIEGNLSDAYELRDNDILVVRSNGNKELIGRCVLARGIAQKTSHSGFTIRVRISSGGVDPEYLTHFMKSGAVRKKLVASGDGANISSLNQKALSSVTVPIPSLTEQRVLVAELDAASEKTRQVASVLARKSIAVDQLQQSLLHQAFSGSL
jgi:type I restriction enzyme S subunit